MSEGFIGEIRSFAFPFAPAGWAVCNGASMPVAQNQALYALLGVYYGGTINKNFNLPNLCGRAMVGRTTNAATMNSLLSQYNIGQQVGAATVALKESTTPMHSHFMGVYNGDSTVNANPTKAPAVFANALPPTGVAPTPAAPNLYASQPGTVHTLNPGSVTSAGAGVAHNNIQPSLGILYCIATNGYFPPRN